MTNITQVFKEMYLPVKALLIYQRETNLGNNMYIESYDINKKGRPINAHPLTIREITELAENLQTLPEQQYQFLQSEGLLPENLLYVQPDAQGFALWHTPAQKVPLLFIDQLGIPCGEACIPPLIWKATRDDLHIYAMKDGKKPCMKTPLYHAPFFNIYVNAKVCMGTVDVSFEEQTSLEKFIIQWQHYFFNSYFSHLLDEHCPVSVNIVQLWQNQVQTGHRFPSEVLIKTGETIKDLLP